MARRRRPVPRRARAVRAREGHRLEAPFAATRTLRVDVAATRSPLQSLEFATLRVKDAVCDRFRADVNVRPVDRQARARRARPRVSHASATPPSTSTRRANRCSSAATGATPTRRRCARTSPRASCAHGLDAGRAVPRSDVRQRHHRHRGRADRGRPRAGPLAHVRIPEARVVRRACVAAHEAGRARPPDARRRRPRSSRATSRRARSRRRNRTCARRRSMPSCTPSRPTSSTRPAPAPQRHPADQSALRRAPRRPAGAGGALSEVGDALKQRFAGWTAYFFTGDLRLPKLIHLKVARRTPLINGAIECRLFEFPMVSGRPGARRRSDRRCASTGATLLSRSRLSSAFLLSCKRP